MNNVDRIAVDEEPKYFTAGYLFQRVRDWANARDIITGSTAKAQFVKLVEEWGEIEADPLDGVGDSLVVLIIISAQCGFELETYVPADNGCSEIAALGMLATALNKDKCPIKAIQLLWGHLGRVSVENGLAVFDCLEHAFEEIEHRKGKMVDGTWVKSEDLK